MYATGSLWAPDFAPFSAISIYGTRCIIPSNACPFIPECSNDMDTATRSGTCWPGVVRQINATLPGIVCTVNMPRVRI